MSPQDVTRHHVSIQWESQLFYKNIEKLIRLRSWKPFFGPFCKQRRYNRRRWAPYGFHNQSQNERENNGWEEFCRLQQEAWRKVAVKSESHGPTSDATAKYSERVYTLCKVGAEIVYHLNNGGRKNVKWDVPTCAYDKTSRSPWAFENHQMWL